MTKRTVGKALAGAAALVVLAQTGCSSMNNTEKGVLAGGAIGAGAGTLIGAATGNPKTGAVVGGLLGAGVGGIAGNEQDRKDERRAEVRAAVADQAYWDAQPQRMSEIVGMAKEGQGERVIVTYIRQHGMRFRLSTADLSYLKQNGVPDGVILEMQSGEPPAVVAARPRPVVIREEVVVREDPYYVRPVVYAPPPRPPVVWVGGGYRRW